MNLLDPDKLHEIQPQLSKDRFMRYIIVANLNNGTMHLARLISGSYWHSDDLNEIIRQCKGLNSTEKIDGEWIVCDRDNQMAVVYPEVAR